MRERRRERETCLVTLHVLWYRPIGTHVSGAIEKSGLENLKKLKLSKNVNSSAFSKCFSACARVGGRLRCDVQSGE